ncbi:subunit of the HIR complex, a nucleosome assembly complex [Pseudozyma hubeiensis SY62]|uniref:Subunit of the HIR complex, a nucleosome assembly complex n=1 Tax=Pseudozyma hubeiensis (strain SY62) TaxID=1305764 RepID=R9P214_PSEHS|nr:subunit of the HIR complex, a nucleosome assembly complex [Pseudozyma hubeiensis SY62]GAC95368.1 subunit of the HIR complex, a nucleosome assembly complex [Pseudozyma hubeiensis SY62]
MRRSSHRVLESVHVLEVFELCLVRGVKTSPEFQRRMETPSSPAQRQSSCGGKEKSRSRQLCIFVTPAKLSELLLACTLFLDLCPPSSDFEDG